MCQAVLKIRIDSSENNKKFLHSRSFHCSEGERERKLINQSVSVS